MKYSLDEKYQNDIIFGAMSKRIQHQFTTKNKPRRRVVINSLMKVALGKILSKCTSKELEASRTKKRRSKVHVKQCLVAMTTT